MTTLARGLFAALVVATFGAFFVAQRLKSQPPVVGELGVTPVLSPNRDGRLDRGYITFRPKRRDSIDLQIVTTGGDEVRELVSSRDVGAGERVRVAWDGRDDSGRRVKDGTYRARIVLRREGRSVGIPRNIRLDTTPPSPRVLSIGPGRTTRPAPELLPNRAGRPASITFFAPGVDEANRAARRPSVEIWRMDRPRPRRVEGLVIDGAVKNGIGHTTWDGTRKGRRVSPGVYVAVVRSRDEAGNIGQSVPDRALMGHARHGRVLPGKGGITVRYLGVQPSLLPVVAGRRFQVAVDARGRTYNWTLRRVGAPRPVLRSRRGGGGPLERATRPGKSGLFLFEARTRERAARVPVVVDDRARHRVLVVLPSTTWQGRNPVDDDGDGLPNTLDLGVPVRLERVFAGDGLPAGLAENEAPLLARLDRDSLEYDLTTDTALAAGRGPQLKGHRGVLLAGDTRWLPRAVGGQLRSFVAGGGVLASLGTQSLRSTVRQTPRRLLAPAPFGSQDLFGARLRPVRTRTVDLTILDDDKRLQLFAGGEGLFPRVRAWEATAAVGGEAQKASTAVTDPGGEPVIVAARFGRGLVIRTGIPGFATRLGSDRSSAELLGRIWTLLRTG